MMLLRDFQFINSFLNDIPEVQISPDTDIQFVYDSEKDRCELSGNIVKLHCPTIISKTLFNVIYSLCEKEISNPHKKDLFSLSLYKTVFNHIYNDKQKNIGPPVLMSCTKLHVPSMIIKELIEPIVDKKIDLLPIMFIKCGFTDSCRIVNSYTDFCDYYKFESNIVPFTKYPFILKNDSINNRAASFSHIFLLQLEHNFGYDVTKNLIKKILLDEKEVVLDGMIKILYAFGNTVKFVNDFLTYLKIYSKVTGIENSLFVSSIRTHYIKNKNLSKFAQDNSAVQKQWTQWSTLLGLTEKQLADMHGSKRELSENMKEYDQEFIQLKKKKMKEKNKKDLNNEEFLEIARERFDTNAIEPGKLSEVLLEKLRDW